MARHFSQPTHRKIFLHLLLCLFLIASPANGQSTTASVSTPVPMPREDRLRIFDQVWRAVYDNYYDRRFHGVDWRIQRDLYRPQAETVSSSEGLYRVLRQMIGKLGDAHTRIYSPDDGFDRHRPSGTTIGVIVRRVEGKPTVTWVDPGSEAARQGIRPGFQVAMVDGLATEKRLTQIREEVGESSTSIALELQSFDRLFYGPRDTAVNVAFVGDNGATRQLALQRKYVEFQRRVTVRKFAQQRIGYIEVTGFGPEIERDFDTAMQSMQGTRGLILDLRNNGGGFVTTVTQVASYFFSEETNLGEFITRQGRSTARQTQRIRAPYREPLVILVSSRSASGSEILAGAMQERRRALIVGTNPTTCGCLLGVSRTLRLTDGGKLNISDTDYRSALGKRIEGIGIRPDRHIDVTVADLLAGRDRPMDVAIEHLGRFAVFGSRGKAFDFKLVIPEMTSGRSFPAGTQQKR
ncbi:MAG: S41 family peptidase [Blastocatellia bacterium]